MAGAADPGTGDRRIDGEALAHGAFTLAPGVALADVDSTITEIIEGELAALPAFIAQLVRGAFSVW